MSRTWSGAGIDSVLVFRIADFTNYQGALALLNGGVADVRRARAIIFDLRAPSASTELGTAEWVFTTSAVQNLLPVRDVKGPPVRRRMHNGFAPQAGSTSGGYWSGTYEVAGAVATAAPNNANRRVVFLVNEGSDIPSIAFALRETGQSAIVVEGSAADAPSPGQSWSVDLTADATAVVRVGEMVGGSQPDTAVARTGAEDAPMRAALELARRPGRVLTPITSSSMSFVPRPENGYASTRFPSMGYRVLAAYRWWTAINYFFPYKHLIGESWDAALPRAIRGMLAATDSLQYALAAAAMVTDIRDTHGGISGSVAFANFMGRVPVGVQVQYVEGKPIVIFVADHEPTKATGIAVGDEIVSVDGEDVAARRSRLARYIAQSTPQALDNSVAARLLRGPDSTNARVTVRDARNQVRELSLPRSMALQPLIAFARRGPIMTMLPGNIGYADLSRLTVPAVDTMFEMFKDTKAIILDGRGYPQGTAWAIAPRLTEKPVAAAAFRRPIAMSPDTTESTTFAFTQPTPSTTKPRYTGKTFMLIDERNISQAEHTGLFFEAANNTQFVGSPTMGANGDVTTVVLPGGITARFTGHDVRHIDGRQLQRVGLQPHIPVKPTLAGIRAGRDEVLEKALEVARKP
jgi:C-terminal processing protease CtpA/Prc